MSFLKTVHSEVFQGMRFELKTDEVFGKTRSYELYVDGKFDSLHRTVKAARFYIRLAK